MSLDNGYMSGPNLESFEGKGIDVYIATGKGEKISPDSIDKTKRDIKKSDFSYDEETDSFICPAGQRIELFSIVSKHHGRFGAALLKKWGFGDDYAQIALHHDSLNEAESITKPLLIIHLANLITKRNSLKESMETNAQKFMHGSKY